MPARVAAREALNRPGVAFDDKGRSSPVTRPSKRLEGLARGASAEREVMNLEDLGGGTHSLYVD